MANVYRDRVKETTATAGTGALALSGAVTGFRTFAASVGVGNTCDYAIVGGNGEWETGRGTLSASATLQRTTVYESSTGGLVNFAAGVKEVFLSPTARSIANLVDKTGDRLTGPLSSAVVDHGTKGAVTEVFDFLAANIHRVTVNGALTIDPQNLAEGDTMQVNVLFQSGSVSVSGTTYWEQGGAKKSTNFADLAVALVANNPYRLVFEMVGGLRTGIFQ